MNTYLQQLQLQEPAFISHVYTILPLSLCVPVIPVYSSLQSYGKGSVYVFIMIHNAPIYTFRVTKILSPDCTTSTGEKLTHGHKAQKISTKRLAQISKKNYYSYYIKASTKVMKVVITSQCSSASQWMRRVQKSKLFSLLDSSIWYTSHIFISV